jgi:hypothetical protein
MVKQTPSKSESYIARNRDGSLVLSVPTIKRANKGKKKKAGKKANKNNSNTAVIDSSNSSDEVKGVNTRSTITSGSNHYHGYTETFRWL